MKRRKKAIIITIVTITIIVGLLQIYDYSMNLSVELPEEIDYAVKEGLETMIDPNKYFPDKYENVDFVFSTSAYHAFGYTANGKSIKVYGIFDLMKFDEECISDYRENNNFTCILGSSGYFLAYLKQDTEGKIVPEKIWTQYSINDSTLDTLKKFPIKTWLFILIGDPHKYDEIHVKEMKQQLHDYVYNDNNRNRENTR